MHRLPWLKPPSHRNSRFNYKNKVGNVKRVYAEKNMESRV
jgi:hypothetical protein